jgi:LPS sulfotransferase NodH
MTSFVDDAGEPRAFIVISSMRSGSTLLVRHLRQMRQTACFGEILREDLPDMDGWPRLVKRLHLPSTARDLHATSASDFWELVLKRTLARRRLVGSKIFADHRRGEDVWDRFAQADHRILHLWRDSTFDSWVSLELARKTGEWKAPTSDASPAQHPRIPFDVEAYERYRGKIAMDTRAVRERYSASTRYVELEYDELTDLVAMGALLERVFGERVALEEGLDRQRSLPKIDYLENPDDARPFQADSLRVGFPATA